MNTPEEFLENNGFRVRTIDRSALLAAFRREMQEGLAGRPSSLKMLPSYVSPEGELRRDVPVTVLDAGGTNLRGATVEFPSEGGVRIEHREKGQMPGVTAYVSPDDFYETFAAHVRRTAPFAKDSSVGFCFSYACETSPEGDGKLLYWTKQIQAPEIIGQWVGAELARRLDPPPPRILVLNDTVTTLLAGKATAKPGIRHSAYIGFILGTGTNIAYVERNANIAKVPLADPEGTMVINTESGGFSKFEQSAFDRAMDARTRDAGAQTFEKMIAGAYLGRLGLEIFRSAARNDFFSPAAAKGILSLGNLESYDLDNFCANHKTEQPNPLERIFTTDADRAVARRLATPVFERSAALTAIHLAAFILQTGGGTDPNAPVCVCIDGSTYYKTRTVSFPKIVQDELDAMLGPRNIAFELAVCPDDAPMIGAAAAVLLQREDRG